MLRRPGRLVLIAALALLVLLVLGRVAAGFYTDLLWYAELGYQSTFLRRLGIGLGVRGVAALVGAAVVFLNLWFVARHLGPVRVRRRYGNIEIAERIPRRHVIAVGTLVAVLGGWWLAQLQFSDSAALAVAAWARHVPFQVADPFFGHDAAFYVFTLPVLLRGVDFLILTTVWSLALVALGHVLVGGIRWEENRLQLNRPPRLHLAALLASMILLLGVRYWIDRYMLVVDGTGIGGALGYTDAEARLPAHWVMAGLAVVAAGLLVRGAWRASLVPPVVGLGALLLGAVLAGSVWPTVVQTFRVEPNELSREAPFIRWHMAFTRAGYGLEDLERQRFPYDPAATPRPERLEPLLARLPLWDPAPLRQTFNQRQSLRRYYHFPDVDYDRYGPPGDERQVGVGVREFSAEGLEDSDPTWQSLRLNPEYIRGLGAVVAPAHRSGNDGAPILWLRNIRPVVREAGGPAGLELNRPSVYFGESMEGYAVVVPGRDSAFTGEPGVDYPGGVPLSSFARVLAFAWRFGDQNLLFSGDVTRESRLIFRRSISERVDEIMPFVLWDSDPLPVVHGSRIVWLLDGYTDSETYPLSRALTMGSTRVRYLRNSVKAAVDAITGEVRFYVLDEDEPVLATYRRLFPALFRPLGAMPAELRRHLRYPELALLAHAEILQEYHVDRPEAFYAGQDVWARPQESAPSGGMVPYRPTYAMMPAPMSEDLEYLATVPFIASSRQNMTGLLVARNDPERYGELTLVAFPEDLQVPGPGQVQAMIEQDPVISPELSFLRQRGSGVDMGHLRVLPLDSSVLYVQPLFLSAEENPIPELWSVVVSDGQAVVMGRDFASAVAGLDVPVDVDVAPRRPTAPTEGPGWSARALDLLDRAEDRLRQGDWAGYGQLLDELRRVLEEAERGLPGEGVGP